VPAPVQNPKPLYRVLGTRECPCTRRVTLNKYEKKENMIKIMIKITIMIMITIMITKDLLFLFLFKENKYVKYTYFKLHPELRECWNSSALCAYNVLFYTVFNYGDVFGQGTKHNTL